MFLSRVLLFVLVGAQLSYANPVQDSNTKPDMPKPPAPPSSPTPPPSETQYEGIGQIDQITRQRGGDLYRLDLIKSLPLVRVEAKAKLGRMRIYSVSLVTDKNEKIPVRQLTGIDIGEPGAAVSSEIFDVKAGIAGIEILTEAMGGEAALEIKAFSTKEAPRLTLGNRIPSFSCKRNIDSLLKDKLEPVQMWVSRAESATPGSVQEKFAGNQLKEQVKDFIATMNTSGTYTSTPYMVTLINFFADQYNAVRGAGVSEPAYKELMLGTYNMLLISIQNELPCRRFPSEDLIKLATDFHKKFQSMPGEARARAHYTAMMGKVGDFAPEQYRKEVAAANLTFRDADNEGTKYYRMYLTAKDGEFLKETHRNMSAYAYMVAEMALKKEVKMMDIEQRYQLIVEYQAKYNSNADFPQAVAARYLNILSEETYGYPFFHNL